MRIKLPLRVLNNLIPKVSSSKSLRDAYPLWRDINGQEVSYLADQRWLHPASGDLSDLEHTVYLVNFGELFWVRLYRRFLQHG